MNKIKKKADCSYCILKHFPELIRVVVVESLNWKLSLKSPPQSYRSNANLIIVKQCESVHSP